MKEVLVTIYKGDLNRSSCEKLLGSNIKANKRRSMAMAEEGLSMEFVHKPRVIRFPGVSFSELEEIADLDDAPPIPPRTRGYTNRDVKTSEYSRKCLLTKMTTHDRRNISTYSLDRRITFLPAHRITTLEFQNVSTSK